MKLIPLSQGQYAIVDDKDFEKISRYKWSARLGHSGYYAEKRKEKGKEHIMLAEYVLGITSTTKIFIDHKDGNTLNNQKLNLRICTCSQNAMNQRKQNRKTTSKYKGVHWHKRERKWVAHIGYEKKNIWIGYFKTENEAGEAYNKAALKYFGEFARLNIIENKGK